MAMIFAEGFEPYMTAMIPGPSVYLREGQTLSMVSALKAGPDGEGRRVVTQVKILNRDGRIVWRQRFGYDT